MPTISPYKAGNAQDEEQDPYKGLSDSNAVDANQPPESPKDSSVGVEPYTPPTTAATPDAQKPEPTDSGPATKTDLPPVRTFSQMEAEGQARPPMPVSDPAAAVTGLLTGGSPVDPPGPPQFAGDNITPPPPVEPPGPPRLAPVGGELTQGTDDNIDPTTGLPYGGMQMGPTDYSGGHGGDQTPPGPIPMSPTPGSGLPNSTDPILSLLTGGASGKNTSELQNATTQATLDQLKNPNPYNADEVKREYADLGAGIDADYDARQRGVSNDFARRGLFGSVGKDFASGRASDTEIGRRSAKEQLASSLATAQAQSAAGAKRDAISQGQAGSQQGQGNQLAWIQQLLGYGNDAFSHDLQTAQFQEGQNNDEQDYLLKLLEAGYGV